MALEEYIVAYDLVDVGEGSDAGKYETGGGLRL
jgi:hypothetical protein